MATLAKVNPKDDREEVERRSQLEKFVSSRTFVYIKLILRYRSLEDIETRSRALLEKGKVARVLDKARDSGEVIGLVEKLRQAILVYQVGARDNQRRKWLTSGIGLATTVHIQPSRSFDCEFLSPPPISELSGWSVCLRHPLTRS